MRSTGIFNNFREVTDWKFDDKKNPIDSINELLACIERITSEGVRLPSNIAAMILLKAVPRHWDNFASMILATTATSAHSVATIVSLIREEWTRWNPTVSANMSGQQLSQSAGPSQWRGHGGPRGRGTHGRGRGRGGCGRPYQRPAEPSGSGNAPLLPPQQQQWPGQMNGQQCSPNTERNHQCRQEQNARKKAFQAQNNLTTNVHMAHMMEYNDPDMIQDERDEEQIRDDNLVEDLGLLGQK